MSETVIGIFVIDRVDGNYRIVRTLNGRPIPQELSYNFADKETAMRAIHRFNGDLR